MVPERSIRNVAEGSMKFKVDKAVIIFLAVMFAQYILLLAGVI